MGVRKWIYHLLYGKQEWFLAAFLESLNHRRTYGLKVFDHSKQHLLAAMKEINFDDFTGEDFEVMGRLQKRLQKDQSESALWGQVAVDLWFCSNFGGSHWLALIERDHANVRFALQAVFWVHAVSGANGAASLAAMLHQVDCWSDAEQAVHAESRADLREFWNCFLLPRKHRECV